MKKLKLKKVVEWERSPILVFFMFLMTSVFLVMLHYGDTLGKTFGVIGVFCMVGSGLYLGDLLPKRKVHYEEIK